jgi:DNA-binding winged helix-turn-helix (wHTH) protein
MIVPFRSNLARLGAAGPGAGPGRYLARRLWRPPVPRPAGLFRRALAAPLADRLVALLLIVGLASAALPALAGLYLLEGQRRQTESARLERSVDVAQHWLGAQLSRDQSVAAEIAARRNVEAAVRFRSQPELRRTLLGLKERTGDDLIAFFDEEGVLIERDSIGTEVVESTPAVLAALGGRATAAVQSTPHGLAIVAASPVMSEGGVVGAVLVGDLLDGRAIGQLRRLTGLEVGLVGAPVPAASLPEWSPAVLEAAVDDGTRRLLETRDRVVGERVLADRSFQVALTPLNGPTGHPIGFLLLALPAARAAEWWAAARLLPVGLGLLSLWAASDWYLRRQLRAGDGGSAGYPLGGGDGGRGYAARETPYPGPHRPPNPGGSPVFPADPGGSFISQAAAPNTQHLAPRTQRPAPVRRSPEEWIRAGPLVVDHAAREVTLAGRPVALTPTEFALLWQLARQAGRALSRDELIDAVWGAEHMAEPAMVDAHVGNLRRKIEPVPGRQTFVVTVRGVGYKFMVPEEANVAR